MGWGLTFLVSPGRNCARLRRRAGLLWLLFLHLASPDVGTLRYALQAAHVLWYWSALTVPLLLWTALPPATRACVHVRSTYHATRCFAAHSAVLCLTLWVCVPEM